MFSFLAGTRPVGTLPGATSGASARELTLHLHPAFALCGVQLARDPRFEAVAYAIEITPRSFHVRPRPLPLLVAQLQRVRETHEMAFGSPCSRTAPRSVEWWNTCVTRRWAWNAVAAIRERRAMGQEHESRERDSAEHSDGHAHEQRRAERHEPPPASH